jgi:Cu2+-exporting ATPase
MKHGRHHGHYIADFKRRLLISFLLPFPSFSSRHSLECSRHSGGAAIPGDLYVLWAFSSSVYFYGGWPFLKGLVSELGDRRLGMMILSWELHLCL